MGFWFYYSGFLNSKPQTLKGLGGLGFLIPGRVAPRVHVTLSGER